MIYVLPISGKNRDALVDVSLRGGISRLKAVSLEMTINNSQ